MGRLGASAGIGRLSKVVLPPRRCPRLLLRQASCAKSLDLRKRRLGTRADPRFAKALRADQPGEADAALLAAHLDISAEVPAYYSPV